MSCGVQGACRPERSYRESAPQGAVPATAGASARPFLCLHRRLYVYLLRGLCFSFAPSTASKRWHLSCLLLSVTKEVRPTAAGRKIPRRNKNQTNSFLILLSAKEESPGWLPEKEKLNPKKSRSVFHIIVENLSAFPPQTKNSKNPPHCQPKPDQKKTAAVPDSRQQQRSFQTVSNIQN